MQSSCTCLLRDGLARGHKFRETLYKKKPCLKDNQLVYNVDLLVIFHDFTPSRIRDPLDVALKHLQFGGGADPDSDVFQ